MSDGARRAGTAGVTLVEMLVVLVLIGTVAGAVGLSLGGDRDGGAAREGQILAARMNRASDEALLGGAAVALVWSDTAYRFLVPGPEGWVPHPLPLLGERHDLGARVRPLGEGGTGGRFVVSADLVPQEGTALEMRLGRAPGEAETVVVWNGARARIAEAGDDRD